MSILAAIEAKVNYHDAENGNEQSVHYWKSNGDGAYFPLYRSGFNARIRLGGNRLVIYSPCRNRRGQFGERKREQISGFSKSSGARMCRYLNECTSLYKTFVTLTYPAGEGFGLDGRKAKRDLKTFMQRLQRQSSEPETFSAFWFMEFQDNNSIHFHLFCTEKFISYQWIASNWFEIVGSGLKKHENSGTSVEKIKKNRFGMLAYARKYAKKQSQKVVPETVKNPGRFWGIYGIRTVAAVTLELSDEYRFNTFEQRKVIEKLHNEVEKARNGGRVFEKKILLPDLSGERTKDIGVTLIEFNNPVSIRRITAIFNNYLVPRGGEVLENRGWYADKMHVQATKE